MSREIKFRLWDKRINNWFQYEAGFALSWDATEIFDDNDHRHNMTDDFVLMQFTGLLDKNGKEIYEGDILRIDGRQSPTQVFWVDSHGLWEHRSDGANNEPLYKVCHRLAMKAVIIGNVYANPELLKP